MNYEEVNNSPISCPYDCEYKSDMGLCTLPYCANFNPMMAILHNLKDVKGFEYTDKEIRTIMEDKIDDNNN